MFIREIFEKYKEHPSAIAIKNAFPCQSFCFGTVDWDKILREIKNLKSSKATKVSDIPTKIVKQNADMFADFLLSSFNECVQEGRLMCCFKKIYVMLVFKKGSRSSKDNYRPVNVLSNISKIFEKPLFKQILKGFIAQL